MKNIQRRDFLKLSAVAALYTLGTTKLEAADDTTGYKAIVVVFHEGGNDSLNMFVPSSSDAKSGYQNYANIRSNIKVSDTELQLPLDSNSNLDLSSGNPYNVDGSLGTAYTSGFYKHNGLDVATNALMPEFAHLVNKGKVAIVANCGNMISPTTKTEYANGSKPKPPFLFAHNHQTKLTLSGEASSLNFSGWAGRVFDKWESVNNGNIYGLNISLSGITHIFEADTTSPLMINPNGPSKYYKIEYSGNNRRGMYDDFLNLPRRDMFTNLYNKIRKHSFDMQDTIVDDWQNNAPDFSSLQNAYGKELFSKPTDAQLQQKSPIFACTSLLKGLSAAAKLAKIGKDAGLHRQIFYLNDGGYDTHNNQTKQHSRKIRGISMAMGDFYKALEYMGMENEVTVLSCSEFARSTGENGDGTDHAWGGSYFVMGGAVKGGLYGTMPDLTLGSDDDMTRKGRLIPTTSFTQYFATVMKWFGADDNTLDKVFPELKNFTQKDLGFMS